MNKNISAEYHSTSKRVCPWRREDLLWLGNAGPSLLQVTILISFALQKGKLRQRNVAVSLWPDGTSGSKCRSPGCSSHHTALPFFRGHQNRLSDLICSLLAAGEQSVGPAAGTGSAFEGSLSI